MYDSALKAGITTVTMGTCSPLCHRGSSGRSIDVPIPQLERVQRPHLIVARVVAPKERVAEPLHCAAVEEPVIVASAERVDDVVSQIRAQPGAERHAEALLAFFQNL